MLAEALGKVKNRKLALAVALALAGVWIGNAMIASPIVRQIKMLENDEGEVAKKEPMLRSIVDLENSLEKHKHALAQTKESAQIIEELSSLAFRSGFAVQSIVPEPPSKTGAGFERLSVRMDAEGTYHELGEFVSQIESLKYLAKIAKVDMSVQKAGGRSGVKISLSVNLFYPSKDADE